MSTNTPTFGQAAHLLTLACQKEVTEQQLTTLYGSGLLSDLLGAASSGADLSKVNRQDFRDFLVGLPRKGMITVNYDDLVSRQIQDIGYDTVGSRGGDMNDNNFPPKGGGTKVVNFELVSTETPGSSTPIVMGILQRRKLRPANIQELIAFDRQHPLVKTVFRVVALGSKCVNEDGEMATNIDNHEFHGSAIGLSLFNPPKGWNPHTIFLAVAE
jgi:hypothetical protein